jgi:hypothetical protein
MSLIIYFYKIIILINISTMLFPGIKLSYHIIDQIDYQLTLDPQSDL